MIELTKLAVIDKDGTLTESISGVRFPEHPKDQKLIDGVAEGITRLKSEGFKIVIASNQGGCDFHRSKAQYLSVGQKFQIFDAPEAKNPFLGEIFTAESIDIYRDSVEMGISVSTGSQDFVFSKSDEILVQFKTVEQAIEEVTFAADLIGCDIAYFCPRMDGESMIQCVKINGQWQSSDIWADTFAWCSNFRKPEPGMLEYAKRSFPKPERWLMIGDRPEDENAALAAGFEFLGADKFHKGASESRLD